MLDIRAFFTVALTMRFAVWGLYAFAYLVSPLPPVFAQIVTGSITGTVADKTGTPMAGVSVTLTSETTAAARTFSTDQTGTIQLNAIQPGNYTLAVEPPAFKRYQKSGIELTPDHQRSHGTITPDAAAA